MTDRTYTPGKDQNLAPGASSGRPKRCAQAWAAALRDGSEFAIEVRHRRHDGVYRWFLTRAAPARDSAGQIVSWFGSTTEIHEFQKLSEEARRESQRRLRFALESAAIGEWEVDLVTGKARTSREHDRCLAPKRLWKTGPSRSLSYVHPEERDEVRRQVRAAYEAQQDSHFECRVIWPDGSVHWLEAHSTTYLNADGKPSHVAGIVSDITARKTSEETLRQAYRHRDEFLANLSRTRSVVPWLRLWVMPNCSVRALRIPPTGMMSKLFKIAAIRRRR